uniref:malate dehydrogenase n=1 Tax=Daucus carota subsp. sativus TaxID=79200 RepID=A0A161ZX22_DAUCS
MLRSAIQHSLRRATSASQQSITCRNLSSSSTPHRKVAVLGAAGGIGQPLSLLMKLNPLVSQLSLYDIAGTPGVMGYVGEDQLAQALEGCDIVIIPAGVPRKPGMTRDDLFNINAGIVKGLCTAIAKYCPNALVNMISNPVNSTVPIASEVFKKAGTYDEKRLFGVMGYVGEDQLAQALEGCDIVIIPAGVPRKPGMTRDDLFNINAGIVKGLCTAIAKYCPNALVNMISNPVNSTVPIASEVFKKAGTYDEKRLFGVTTLDVVRAKTFYAGKANVNVAEVNVPVVGGHAGITILPLFSQATPQANNLSDEVLTALTKRTQDGGTEVVEAKAGKGSATLSMAYAGALFADACMKGLNGVPDVVECSFVQSSITELPFFVSKVRLGKNGVEEVLGLGALSDYEKQGLEALLPELKSSIEKGIKFANQS